MFAHIAQEQVTSVQKICGRGLPQLVSSTSLVLFDCARLTFCRLALVEEKISETQLAMRIHI